MAQVDPVRATNTREWLLRASEDLAAAERVLSGSPPLVRTALFHCQQAVEKAFKALLTWNDVPFRRIHILEEIGEACVRADPSLAPIVARATPLSVYAVRFRYPGAPYQPTLEEAQAAHALAREVVDAIMDRLPEEARP
ncbi:MAG: HEPN domain-containing protein [Bryobacteraceae bacterium]